MTHVQLYKPNQIWHVYKNDAFTNISANQYDSITHVSNYLSQTKYNTYGNIRPNQIWNVSVFNCSCNCKPALLRILKVDQTNLKCVCEPNQICHFF